METLGAAGPARVGPFRVLAVLGQGGMGRVLLGVAQDGRPAAVKQVHAEYAEDDGFRARLRREVEASRRVSGGYTAAVIAADPDAPTPWLAAQFVPGPTLAEVVGAAGPLPEEAVRRLAAGLAQALVDVHRAGLIHRDLKPSNVLLAGDGVRVIDFGIARAAEEASELTRTGGVIGSPAYMSPEQAEGRALGPASDVFSLGSLLVLALCGRSPFAGATTLQTLYNVVHTEPDLGAVPAATRPLLAACLAKDPAARPTPERLLDLLGSVAQVPRPWPEAVHALIAAQQRAVDGLLGAPEARTVVIDPRAAPRGRRRARRTAAPAVAGVLVAGLGVGGYLLWGPQDGTGVPDKYLKAPICAEAAGGLHLPADQRKPDKDWYVERSGTAQTRCSWYGSSVVQGVRSEDRDPSATVQWSCGAARATVRTPPRRSATTSPTRRRRTGRPMPPASATRPTGTGPAPARPAPWSSATATCACGSGSGARTTRSRTARRRPPPSPGRRWPRCRAEAGSGVLWGRAGDGRGGGARGRLRRGRAVRAVERAQQERQQYPRRAEGDGGQHGTEGPSPNAAGHSDGAGRDGLATLEGNRCLGRLGDPAPARNRGEERWPGLPRRRHRRQNLRSPLLGHRARPYGRRRNVQQRRQEPPPPGHFRPRPRACRRRARPAVRGEQRAQVPALEGHGPTSSGRRGAGSAASPSGAGPWTISRTLPKVPNCRISAGAEAPAATAAYRPVTCECSSQPVRAPRATRLRPAARSAVGSM
ncbi:serine/threonine-protein kinase [Streptomyces sp. Y1]|uniref:Serine/threonine-protein kinase n=1 Tax=Streptomyces sp. Y1 TaxID=3238634 RepID=A0AB39TCH4_9ACTN